MGNSLDRRSCRAPTRAVTRGAGPPTRAVTRGAGPPTRAVTRGAGPPTRAVTRGAGGRRRGGLDMWVPHRGVGRHEDGAGAERNVERFRQPVSGSALEDALQA